MNTDTFLAVADVIEYADRFDLNYWGARRDPGTDIVIDDVIDPDIVWEDCNTTACVCGWVNAWADHAVYDGYTAAEELGIDHDEAQRLFHAGPDSIWARLADEYGWTVRWDNWLVDPSQITAAQAADVLRRIARGEVTL